MLLYGGQADRWLGTPDTFHACLWSLHTCVLQLLLLQNHPLQPTLSVCTLACCQYFNFPHLPMQLRVNSMSWLAMLLPLSTDTTTTSFCLQLRAVLLAP